MLITTYAPVKGVIGGDLCERYDKTPMYLFIKRATCTSYEPIKEL